MKKIALFILLLFATVQVVPGVLAFSSKYSQGLVFNEYEDKNADKSPSDNKKEEKEYPAYESISAALTNRLNTALHLADKLAPAPYLEMLTPPPNC